MDPSLVGELVKQGILGILLVVVGTVAWLKDRELRDERQARIEDAQKYNKLAMELQAKVIDAVNKLSAILTETKKLMGRRTSSRSLETHHD